MDVTTGYGPEIFAMPAPVHGRYQVYINYYGGRSETELTTAQLTLITDEGSVNEKQETFIVPMRNAGELTLVKSFASGFWFAKYHFIILPAIVTALICLLLSVIISAVVDKVWNKGSVVEQLREVE